MRSERAALEGRLESATADDGIAEAIKQARLERAAETAALAEAQVGGTQPSFAPASTTAAPVVEAKAGPVAALANSNAQSGGGDSFAEGSGVFSSANDTFEDFGDFGIGASDDFGFDSVKYSTTSGGAKAEVPPGGAAFARPSVQGLFDGSAATSAPASTGSGGFDDFAFGGASADGNGGGKADSGTDPFGSFGSAPASTGSAGFGDLGGFGSAPKSTGTASPAPDATASFGSGMDFGAAFSGGDLATAETAANGGNAEAAGGDPFGGGGFDNFGSGAGGFGSAGDSETNSFGGGGAGGATAAKADDPFSGFGASSGGATTAGTTGGGDFDGFGAGFGASVSGGGASAGGGSGGESATASPVPGASFGGLDLGAAFGSTGGSQDDGNDAASGEGSGDNGSRAAPALPEAMDSGHGDDSADGADRADVAERSAPGLPSAPEVVASDGDANSSDAAAPLSGGGGGGDDPFGDSFGAAFGDAGAAGGTATGGDPFGDDIFGAAFGTASPPAGDAAFPPAENVFGGGDGFGSGGASAFGDDPFGSGGFGGGGGGGGGDSGGFDDVFGGGGGGGGGGDGDATEDRYGDGGADSDPNAGDRYGDGGNGDDQDDDLGEVVDGRVRDLPAPATDHIPDNWIALLSSNADLSGETAALQAGIPPAIRGQIWQQLVGATGAAASNAPNTYGAAVVGFTPFYDVIERDVRNVFSTLESFGKMTSNGDAEAAAASLTEILNALATHDPDVSYSPALGHIVCLACSQIGADEDVFWFVSSMLSTVPEARNLFAGASSQIDALLNALSVELEARYPAVAESFAAKDVALTSLFRPWFASLFAEGLPDSLALRLWDMFLGSGGDWNVFVAAALHVVELNEGVLVHKDRNGIVRAIRSVGEGTFDADVFVEGVVANMASA